MREFLKHRRQGHSDSAAKRVNCRSRRGAQHRASSVLLDLDLAEVGKIIHDLLPFRHGEMAGCQPVDQLLAQHQSEERAEDVAADGGIGSMKDRPRGQQRLGACKPLGLITLPLRSPRGRS